MPGSKRQYSSETTNDSVYHFPNARADTSQKAKSPSVSPSLGGPSRSAPAEKEHIQTPASTNSNKFQQSMFDLDANFERFDLRFDAFLSKAKALTKEMEQIRTVYYGEHPLACKRSFLAFQTHLEDIVGATNRLQNGSECFLDSLLVAVNCERLDQQPHGHEKKRRKLADDASIYDLDTAEEIRVKKEFNEEPAFERAEEVQVVHTESPPPTRGNDVNKSIRLSADNKEIMEDFTTINNEHPRTSKRSTKKRISSDDLLSNSNRWESPSAVREQSFKNNDPGANDLNRPLSTDRALPRRVEGHRRRGNKSINTQQRLTSSSRNDEVIVDLPHPQRGWKITAPKHGEPQDKRVRGMLMHWCDSCSCWSSTHGSSPLAPTPHRGNPLPRNEPRSDELLSPLRSQRRSSSTSQRNYIDESQHGQSAQIKVKHSIGRTRAEMNELLRKQFKMAFFDETSSFFRSGKVFTHIIVDSSLGDFVGSQGENQCLYVNGNPHTGQPTRSAEVLLESLKGSRFKIPIFYAPDNDNAKIYYIGHYSVIPSSVEYYNGTNSFGLKRGGKAVWASIELEFQNFSNRFDKAICNIHESEENSE